GRGRCRPSLSLRPHRRARCVHRCSGRGRSGAGASPPPSGWSSAAGMGARDDRRAGEEGRCRGPASDRGRGAMRVALTSFRISIAAMLGARLLGALGGVLLSQIWQNEPALASARATFSAQSLLTGNLKGTAAVGLLSGATGGVAGLLFSLSDGLRYGLALSGGAVAAPAHGLAAEVAFLAVPWPEVPA